MSIFNQAVSSDFGAEEMYPLSDKYHIVRKNKKKMLASIGNSELL